LQFNTLEFERLHEKGEAVTAHLFGYAPITDGMLVDDVFSFPL
jgi:hypothetical protein